MVYIVDTKKNNNKSNKNFSQMPEYISWHFSVSLSELFHVTILWPPHVKNWLIWKDSDAGRDWGQEEKGTTEDEMAGWHHRLNGHEFEWTLGIGDGQGGLACCSHGVAKSQTQLSDWTELNWTEAKLHWIEQLRPTLLPLRSVLKFPNDTSVIWRAPLAFSFSWRQTESLVHHKSETPGIPLMLLFLSPRVLPVM